MCDGGVAPVTFVLCTREEEQRRWEGEDEDEAMYLK